MSNKTLAIIGFHYINSNKLKLYTINYALLYNLLTLNLTINYGLPQHFIISVKLRALKIEIMAYYKGNLKRVGDKIANILPIFIQFSDNG